MTVKTAALTCVMRNLVSLSGSRPFSLDRIISSMSPWSFSITTNTFSGVSNMHSRFTIPKCRRLWERMKGQDKEMLVEWVTLLLICIHDLMLGVLTISRHTAGLIVLYVFIIIQSIQWHSLATQFYVWWIIESLSPPAGHLQYGYFIPQLALLLGGEPELVDHLHGYIPASFPVFSCVGWGNDYVLYMWDLLQMSILAYH